MKIINSKSIFWHFNTEAIDSRRVHHQLLPMQVAYEEDTNRVSHVQMYSLYSHVMRRSEESSVKWIYIFLFWICAYFKIAIQRHYWLKSLEIILDYDILF